MKQLFPNTQNNVLLELIRSEGSYFTSTFEGHHKWCQVVSVESAWIRRDGTAPCTLIHHQSKFFDFQSVLWMLFVLLQYNKTIKNE
jgi:hypothetical protein